MDTNRKWKQFQLCTFKDIDTADQDAGKGIIRLAYSFANEIGIKRNALVRVTHRDSKKKKRTVYLVCRMSRDLKKDEAAIEYDTSRDLGLVAKEAALYMRPARIWELDRYLQGHPDPIIRFAHRQTFLASLLTFIAGLFLEDIWEFLRNLVAGTTQLPLPF